MIEWQWLTFLSPTMFSGANAIASEGKFQVYYQWEWTQWPLNRGLTHIVEKQHAEINFQVKGT